MTHITVTRCGGHAVRVEAKGHSGYADAGSDIVCAAVTASFRLASAQLDAAGTAQKVEQNDDIAYLAISAEGGAIFEGFASLMEELSREYPENISYTEVEQNA